MGGSARPQAAPLRQTTLACRPQRNLLIGTPPAETGAGPSPSWRAARHLAAHPQRLLAATTTTA